MYAGTKSLSLRKHTCEEDTHVLSLSGIPEVNGDHVADIDFSSSVGIGWAYKANGVDPLIPISGSASFLFTSAGETYTIYATITAADSETNNPYQFKLPYSVSAVYAPAWAFLTGEIVVSVDTGPLVAYPSGFTIVDVLPEICTEVDSCESFKRLVAYFEDVDECTALVLGVTVNGVKKTLVASTCVETLVSVNMVKKLASSYRLCLQDHEGANVATTHDFWVTEDIGFRGDTVEITSIDVTSSEGVRNYPLSIGESSTKYTSYNLSGTCDAVPPLYVDKTTLIGVKTSITSAQICLGAAYPGDLGGVYGLVGTAYPLSVSAGECDSVPRSATLTVPSTYQTKEFLEQIINTSGTAQLGGGLLGWTVDVSVDYTITKACGSNQIFVTSKLYTTGGGGSITVGETGSCGGDSDLRDGFSTSIPGLGADGRIIIEYQRSCSQGYNGGTPNGIGAAYYAVVATWKVYGNAPT